MAKSFPTKVLNPVRWDYPGFFIELDALASHPVPILGIEDVPRCSDWDVGMLVGRPVSAHGMVSHLSIPQDVLMGPSLLPTTKF